MVRALLGYYLVRQPSYLSILKNLIHNKRITLVFSIIVLISFFFYFFKIYRKEKISISKSLKMAWKSAIFIIVLLFGPIRMKEASSIDQVHGWSSSKQYSSRPGQNQSNNGLFGQKSNSQGFHTQSNGGNRTTTGSSGGDKKPSSSSTVEFDPVNQSGNRRVHSKTSNFNEVFQELQKYGPKTVGPQDIRAFDNDVLTLTDRANDHLLSKHGQDFGINDPLPKNSNQKPTKYNK